MERKGITPALSAKEKFKIVGKYVRRLFMNPFSWAYPSF